jgi:hypothetical protein
LRCQRCGGSAPSFFDFLSLDAQKLRQPAAFADGDKIESGCRTVRIQFRLDNEVLQNAFGGDAHHIGLDRRLALRRLAGILRGLLDLLSGMKISVPPSTMVSVPCSPSQANFLLATVSTGGRWHSAEKVYRSLMPRCVFVRWFNEEELRDKLRISIGTPEENQHLVEALRLLGVSE